MAIRRPHHLKQTTLLCNPINVWEDQHPRLFVKEDAKPKIAPKIERSAKKDGLVLNMPKFPKRALPITRVRECNRRAVCGLHGQNIYIILMQGRVAFIERTDYSLRSTCFATRLYFDPGRLYPFVSFCYYCHPAHFAPIIYSFYCVPQDDVRAASCKSRLHGQSTGACCVLRLQRPEHRGKGAGCEQYCVVLRTRDQGRGTSHSTVWSNRCWRGSRSWEIAVG